MAAISGHSKQLLSALLPSFSALHFLHSSVQHVQHVQCAVGCTAERMAGAGGHIAGPMRPACLGGRPIGQCWETDLISNKTGILYIQCMLCILRNIERSKNAEPCYGWYVFKRISGLAELWKGLKKYSNPPFSSAFKCPSYKCSAPCKYNLVPTCAPASQSFDLNGARPCWVRLALYGSNPPY